MSVNLGERRNSFFRVQVFFIIIILVLNQAIKNLFLWVVSRGWTIQIITSILTPTHVVLCLLKAFNQSVVILWGSNLTHTPTVLKLPKVLPASRFVFSSYLYPFIKEVAGLSQISFVSPIIDWFTGLDLKCPNVKWENLVDVPLFFFSSTS